jgi:DNA-binding PadR family transcriptional regulator
MYTIIVTSVVYVPIAAKWLDIVHLKPNKTESVVLGTLAKSEYGNAYSIWKASGLKHYPTVLRTLKKLEKKSLVKTVDKNGKRGETTYSSTFQGTLVFYIFSNNENKLIELLIKVSRLFRELNKLEGAERYATGAIRDFILNSQKEKMRLCFDDALEETMLDFVRDNLSDFWLNSDKEAEDWLIKMSRVEWIRQIILANIRNQRIMMSKGAKNLEILEKAISTS